MIGSLFFDPVFIMVFSMRFPVIIGMLLAVSCFGQVYTPGPAAAFEKIVAEREKEVSDFGKAYQAASTEERKELIKTRPEPGPSLEKVAALVKANPGDPMVPKALVWMVQQGRCLEPVSSAALTDMLEKHINSEEMNSLVGIMPYLRHEKAKGAIKVLAESSPHRNVKAKAIYVLADMGTRELASRSYQGDREADEAEIVKKLELLKREFADVPTARNRSIGELADAKLFSMTALAIGKVAPEIEGENGAGVAMKLSDYRGKVVLIDFWGDW